MTGCQSLCDFRSSPPPRERVAVKEEIQRLDLWDRFLLEDESYQRSEEDNLDRWLDLNA